MSVSRSLTFLWTPWSIVVGRVVCWPASALGGGGAAISAPWDARGPAHVVYLAPCC